MKTIRVADDIFQLAFTIMSEELGAEQDIILTVLQDGDRALLIDSGYPKQAYAARGTLEAQGIRPEVVVLSHYHPDHAAGCVAFEDCEIIAHPAYRRSYEFYQVIFPDECYIEPTRLTVAEQTGESFNFGRFEVQLLAMPGHSPDSLTTLIDGRIAHIGDLLAYDSAGRVTLPFLASGGDFQAFIESLERLNALGAEVVLPSHGPHLIGRAALESDTRQMIHYLERIVATRGDAPLEDLLDRPPESYCGHSFHQKNLKRLRKMLGR